MPAGDEGGWYAAHCAIHCWLSAVRQQNNVGLDPVSNLGLSGLHTVIGEIIEHEGAGDHRHGKPGWGYEPWYDRVADAYANTYGATLVAKGCVGQRCWVRTIWRQLEDAYKAAQCCDEGCAQAQPKFKDFERSVRAAAGMPGKLWRSWFD